MIRRQLERLRRLWRRLLRHRVRPPRRDHLPAGLAVVLAPEDDEEAER